MSADEAPAAVAAEGEAATETPTTATTEEKENSNKDNKNNNGSTNTKKKQYPKREHKPIEELFDLSQPIPKVEKPDKAAHDAAIQEISAAMDDLKAQRQTVQEQIDAQMADPASKSQLQELRERMNTLKTQKTSLINEKKSLRTQMDSHKSETDKLLKDKKDTRANLKYSTAAEFDAAIAKLQREQETTSMSLQDEKKLIREMEQLKSSKKLVSSLQDQDGALDSVREQRKNLSTIIAGKDTEIDALNKDMDEIMAQIKSMNDKDSTKRDAIQVHFKKRDELRKEMTDKIAERDALRDDFRSKNDAWYDYQRAVRAKKKMEYEEEKRKREEEKAAYTAKIEAEEAKKIPYEEEQNLCEYLADYLERTYIKTNGKSEETSTKKDDKIEVKDDPFAGMTPVSKKSEEDYFGKGKGKKKRVRANKKQDQTAGPFTLSVDMFEQFGLVQLAPPHSLDQVENSIKQLREKKTWYKEQPRGSVPTATEIRRSNEKAAMKARDAKSQPAAPTGKKGGFNLSTDDFAPLSGAGNNTAGVNATWGKSEAPTPAEEAIVTEDEEAS